MIQIYTSNDIILDGQNTGLKVTQDRSGTIVYTPEIGYKRQDVVDGEVVWLEPQRYQEHKMPRQRYSLAHDKPASGAAGRAQFETDIRALLETL